MSTCCICLEEATDWFVVGSCQHRWCTACEKRYEGNLCVLCRCRFRETKAKEKRRPRRRLLSSYSISELEDYFGVLPNQKTRRRKYYRALRQHFRHG
jgi:hypothetical protein